MESGASQPVSFPAVRVCALMAVYTFCFLDRQIVNILAEPIKRDLGLSDVQLGLLTGLSFALFYTILGLPLAHLAERRNRSVIISVCLIAWSAFTILCGLAQNLAWLLLARIGVGVGEAGCLPASHSMISDYVPKRQKAWALAIFQAGSPLGILLGMAVGGIIAEQWGWRAAFVAAGLPGLFLACGIMLGLRDQKRESRGTGHVEGAFLKSLHELLRLRQFRGVVIAAMCATFVSYAQGSFIASYFLRAYPQALADAAGARGALTLLGPILGIILGGGGVFGTLAGGAIGDCLFKRFGLPGYLHVSAVGCLGVAPLFFAVLAVNDLWAALLFLIPSTVLNTLWPGPAFAAVQAMAPAKAHATAAAVMLFFITIVGLGMGPVVVGALSDHFAHAFGEARGLRLALLSTTFVSLSAGLLFWAASRRSIA